LAFQGRPTVATIVVVIAALLAIFIFFPVGKVLTAALFDARGAFAPASRSICSRPTSGARVPRRRHALRRGDRSACGDDRGRSVHADRARARAGRAARRPRRGRDEGVSILPIVTPPFVIALALVVLFGRTGLITGGSTARSAAVPLDYGLPASRSRSC
jgi:iron(III) transport system permease protein